MIHTYPYAMVRGHLIAHCGELQCLIDTGAPLSVCAEPPLLFAGTRHPAQYNYMGVSCDSLSTDVGCRVDALVGADVLQKYDVLIEPSESTIVVSDDSLPLDGCALAIDDFMGIPIVSAFVNGKTVRMFFDTGARLSYLDPDICSDFSSAGSQEDFYPGMGKFRTETFRVPIVLGTEEMELCVGILPKLLQMTLMMDETTGILGTAVLEKYRVCFAPRRKTLNLKPR